MNRDISLPNEIWKDIKGYEGLYQVSNLGRVRSLDRVVERSNGRDLPLKGRLRKQRDNGHGYLIVGLSKDDKKFSAKVHRLVAEAFIENPHNKPQVNHIDGDKTNNHYTNLEWATPWENQMHAINNGLKISQKGQEHPMSKLTEREVLAIRILHKEYKVPSRKLALMFNISKTQILDISNENSWSHISKRSDCY